MDNVSSHVVLTDLPHPNIELVYLPPNVTGYLQACDVLYNAVFKLKFKLMMEDYLLDCHLDNVNLGCKDEEGARMAADAYYDVPKGIIKAWNIF